MNYWRMVLRRAVRETVEDTERDPWAAMVVLVGPVLASGVLWLPLGYALPDSAVWARMVAAAVPLLLVPVAFVRRLAAVPAALHSEATKRIAELEQQLADLDSTRARNRAALMRFYSDAQPILDRGFELAPIDLAGFISEIEIWISSTATWIAEHMGEAALSRFTDHSGWRSAHVPAALKQDCRGWPTDVGRDPVFRSELKLGSWRGSHQFRESMRKKSRSSLWAVPG